ncbi:MAG: hypothetical protein ACI9RG_000703 [Sulfurimonas sp.]|jgi:hypothetical protein
MKIFIALITLSTFIFVGCAGSVVDPANKTLRERKSPTRLIKDETFKRPGGTRFIPGWAGVKRKSIINDEYKEKSFRYLRKRCGYSKSDFIQSRKVEYTKITWEEVWLFQDSKSYRDDKISGITIFFKYNPNNNKTSFAFYGACHTGKGTSFTTFD